ncbi:MAG: hypothetical protein SNH01_08015, partial [Rikenellaceae bacterium]
LSTYITANMQGTSDKSISETTKPLYAPTSATYLAIYAYDSKTEQAVTYKMYLGADMKSDYNIVANKHYTYTFTFNSVGEIGSDSRIEAMTTEVDYRDREDSNCYIINPSMVGSRTYYLPVQNRIYDFWADYGSDASKSIANSTDWTVEVLWYDCDSDPIATDIANLSSSKLCIQPINSDSNELDDKQQSVKVTLGEKFDNYGNVVFAVKSKDGEILWSWHLWITDYNPDSRDWTPTAGQYTYATSGGEIHRYKDSSTSTTKYWDVGGIYENSFIMDRNLGARDASYPSSYGAGVIYYQFGRKDPFPGNASSINVTTTETSSGESFATAVQNPTIYYCYTNSLYDWCSEVASDSTTCLWNDENASSTTDKSIFDPSPLGWKLPITGTWSDFSTSTFTYDVFDGLTYNGYAYYPASGIRGSASGTLSYAGTYGYYWSASPYSGTQGHTLYLSSSNVNATNTSYRAAGFPVRPVRE